MIRDRIVALKEYTSSTVNDPLALGALRGPESNPSWRVEAQHALDEGCRAILSGDISDLNEIAADVRSLIANKSGAQVALLIHWSQAYHIRPDPHDLKSFESIYVAIDEEVSAATSQLICQRWPVQWVIVPRLGISWSTWIPNILNSKPHGYLTVLSPAHSKSHPRSNYLSADELALHISQLSMEHPLVKISPAPHEWFVPTELSPWGLNRRDHSRSQITHDSRKNTEKGEPYGLSFVVPFRWTGSEAELKHLQLCLTSIESVRRGREDWELIVSVDRESEIEPISVTQIRRGIMSDLGPLAIVDNPRPSPTSMADSSDWRAGFVRNCGVLASQFSSEYIAFLDADVRISNSPEVRRILESLVLKNSATELLLVSENCDVAPSFRCATSSFLVVERNLFRKIGGFADGFQNYGCEDNFLVWSAQNIGSSIRTVSSSYFEHLRESTSADTVPAKMIRLQRSADLMYRMTLDPNVHAHFYSALGERVWLRAALKNGLEFRFLRVLVAPLVFLVTIVQVSSRKKYLFGFYEIVSWSIRRHSWKIPVFMARVTGQTWKIKVFTQRVSGKFAEQFARVSGQFERLAGQKWRIKVFTQRVSGKVGEKLAKMSGILRKCWVICIVVPASYIFSRPKHWLRQYGWIFPAATLRLKEKFSGRRGSDDCE